MKTNHFNPDKKNQQAIMLHIRVMAGVLKFRQTYFKISVICLEKNINSINNFVTTFGTY